MGTEVFRAPPKADFPEEFFGSSAALVQLQNPAPKHDERLVACESLRQQCRGACAIPRNAHHRQVGGGAGPTWSLRADLLAPCPVAVK